MDILDTNSIISAINIPEDNILSIFVYGSRVYGTNTPSSDWDIVCVVADLHFEAQKLPLEEEIQYRLESPARDITLYSETHLHTSLNAHDIKTIELVLCPPQFKLLDKKNYAASFKLDLSALRSAVSAKCDHSWTKAMKKLTVEKDLAPLVAKKSLFHAFRMNQFAIDLVESHRAGQAPQIQFHRESLVELFKEIINDESNDWNHFKEKFRARYNASKSLLRKMIPK